MIVYHTLSPYAYARLFLFILETCITLCKGMRRLASCFVGVALPPLSRGAGAAVAGATPILPLQKRKGVIAGSGMRSITLHGVRDERPLQDCGACGKHAGSPLCSHL